MTPSEAKELKHDIIAGFCVALVFASVFLWWPHTDLVREEKAAQRQHAVEFLRDHRFEMDPMQVKDVQKFYGINDEEIMVDWTQQKGG